MGPPLAGANESTTWMIVLGGTFNCLQAQLAGIGACILLTGQVFPVIPIVIPE